MRALRCIFVKNTLPTFNYATISHNICELIEIERNDNNRKSTIKKYYPIADRNT